ncbi:MAG TPA: ABC transporter substrate binding protein [Stellaceae bacterium]|nr:ABC transporter substrate binding protein [Stellaceae bacterium]
MAARPITPVAFVTGADPVKLGLVESLARPGANATGVTVFLQSLIAKRLELLHQLVPNAKQIADLTDLNYPGHAPPPIEAARLLGLELRTQSASTLAELDQAFAAFANDRLGGVLIAVLPFFISIPTRSRILSLAMKYGIPTQFGSRDQTEAGNVMSYGASLTIPPMLLARADEVIE